MNDQLIIYHGNCADGFGAAWAARQQYPDAEFYAGKYQEQPPDVTDKYVYMLDFSYKRDVIRQMAKQAKQIIIIDHHKSAEQDLRIDPNDLIPGVEVFFDMNKSGAILSWEFFNINKPIPELIKYIQDRDLWRHELPNTHEVSAALFSYPYDFEVWTGLMTRPNSIAALVEEGRGILRKQKKDLEELLPQTKRPMFIGGYSVYGANLPYQFSSEAGHILAEGMPFGATYFDTPEGRQFSLRSREDGIDVSEVAKQYGGGGHKHAAGFKVSRGHSLAVQ